MSPLSAKPVYESDDRISEGMKVRISKRCAPDVGVGVIDAEGLRSFIGFGLEALDAKPSHRQDAEVAGATHRPDLFSDLNQWMLKILIGQASAGDAHRGAERSYPERVSARRYGRCVGHECVAICESTVGEKILDRRDDLLPIARVDELLDLWVSANRDTAHEIPARWIIKKGPDQLKLALRDYAPSRPVKGISKKVPRCCLAVFAAANELGYGLVHGVPAHICLESMTLDALGRLGLAVDDSGRSTDVYVKRAVNREAVFRSQLTRDGISASDILQVWLDTSKHPSRGKGEFSATVRKTDQSGFIFD